MIFTNESLTYCEVTKDIIGTTGAAHRGSILRTPSGNAQEGDRKLAFFTR